MSTLNILVLGSTGFVGGTIARVLRENYHVYTTARDISHRSGDTIHFDLEEQQTWENILKIRPDVIINSAGYGVVKHQKEQDRMQQVNYYQPYRLKEYLDSHLSAYSWVQIGTAFEYDLAKEKLHEGTAALPMTSYGISKALFSQYLLLSPIKNFIILRPFAMFGPGEDASKFIPSLLLAQKEKRAIDLSTGEQQRDYFYVKDLAIFIGQLLKEDLDTVTGQVINVGSSHAISLREFATRFGAFIPDFDPTLWRWGMIEQRQNESRIFFNDSNKCKEIGFQETPFEEACRETINYYYQSQI